MELRQFRYFVAVAEELHFTRAAQRLNIGQPPLSLQIKAIERELGVSLLKRTRRKVELTPAGALFLQEARLALLQAAHAVDTVVRAAKGEIGTLRLSFVTSAPLIDAFSGTIRSFRQSHPEVHLTLRSRSSEAIMDEVLLNTIDVGFTRPAIQWVAPPTIRAVPIYEDHLMVVLPLDHPLNRREGPIPISALRSENFVLRPRGSGTGFYEQVFNMCTEAGFVPNINQEAVEATTTLGLVAAGMGVTIAPRALQAIRVRDAVWRDLSDCDTRSRVLMIYNRSVTDNRLRDRFIRHFPNGAASLDADAVAGPRVRRLSATPPR
jgi:DNA-binding transcriptional LysR family regulator